MTFQEALRIIRQRPPQRTAAATPAAGSSRPAAAESGKQGEELGRRAAACYTEAVRIAGEVPGTVPGRRAAKVAEGMITDLLTERMR